MEHHCNRNLGLLLILIGTYKHFIAWTLRSTSWNQGGVLQDELLFVTNSVSQIIEEADEMNRLFTRHWIYLHYTLQTSLRREFFCLEVLLIFCRACLLSLWRKSCLLLPSLFPQHAFPLRILEIPKILLVYCCFLVVSPFIASQNRLISSPISQPIFSERTRSSVIYLGSNSKFGMLRNSTLEGDFVLCFWTMLLEHAFGTRVCVREK